MKVKFSTEANSIFDAIMRMTYGYSRKWAPISQDMFMNLTLIDRRNIFRAQKWLLDRNMVEKKAGGGRGNPSEWSIQKNYEAWQIPEEEQRNYVTQDVELKINYVTACTETTSRTQEKTTSPVTYTKAIKTNKTKRARAFNNNLSIKDIRIQINELKKIGINRSTLKSYLINQNIPENLIDQAMGKAF